MKPHIRNRLTMPKRGVVAAEIAARGEGLRSFVAVIPQPDQSYRVFRFDVPSDATAENRYLSPDEVLNTDTHIAQTVDDAEDVLRGMGVDPDLLDVPWASDFPL
jgi:hypothetical protein